MGPRRLEGEPSRSTHEELSLLSNDGQIVKKESLCGKHKGEIIEDATRSNHGGGIMEKESLRRTL